MPSGPPAPDFATWYASAFPTISRALALAAGDPVVGEEATAEAFARALARWSRVGTMASPEAWTYAVAVNELRRTWRRAALERRALARHREDHVPPPAEPDDALWRAVAQLPPRQRTAVALRYVADLPEADIADAMNVTRGTVAASLAAARKTLSTRLVPDDASEATTSTPEGVTP